MYKIFRVEVYKMLRSKAFDNVAVSDHRIIALKVSVWSGKKFEMLLFLIL